MKKVFVPVLIIIALIIMALVAVYFLVFRQPGQYIPGSLSEISCTYFVSVQGNSMEPAIKNGTLLSANKCIDNKDELEAGQIIVFSENGVNRIGRISQKLSLAEGVFYKVTRDGRPGEEFTIKSATIIAVGADTE